MDFTLLSLTIYPAVFLLGVLVGWLTQRFRLNSLKTKLEDKANYLREIQKNAGRMKEEIKAANFRYKEVEALIADNENAVEEMQKETLSLRQQLAERDAVWRERLEILQRDFSKKESEFQRISAVTAGMVPLRKQLQQREEEVSFLRMQIQNILANHGNGITKEDIKSFSESLFTLPNYQAEIDRLQARIKELEGNAEAENKFSVAEANRVIKEAQAALRRSYSETLSENDKAESLTAKDSATAENKVSNEDFPNVGDNTPKKELPLDEDISATGRKNLEFAEA